MSFLQILVLSIVQGLAELLPISSSAHVVVAEKLMGIDPSSPQATLLLVLLHTGTMFAVVAYFWKRWQVSFFRDQGMMTKTVLGLGVATGMTGIVGEMLVVAIEHLWLRWFRGNPQAEVEQLFSHLELIAPALAAVGLLILIASKSNAAEAASASENELSPRVAPKQAVIVGVVQGLSLPFRGFSRSGATISTAMLAGVDKRQAEDFSFALAVILTPPVVVRETLRLVKAQRVVQGDLFSGMSLGIVGGFCAFLTGLLALRWLSQWLEGGRWRYFGVYCLLASAVVTALYYLGY
ncbi:MAG TPA: undecaprenyl-diphosphate phosphatase [Vicinamibacterales bacterium]|nr:undecaprenyl-diphosphate phosphatase [Vicinamibacterales bacterium]